MLSKSCPKIATAVIFTAWKFFKTSQKVDQIIFGYFCTTICCKDLLKIAQSGHAVRERGRHGGRGRGWECWEQN